MGLRENLRTEPVTALSLRKLVTVRPTELVRDVVQTMREQQVGSVVVMDEAGLPMGLFTEKLLIRMYAQHPESLAHPVHRHMSQRIVCLKQTDSISDLIEVMQENRLRWICITDGTGQPVAMAGLRAVIGYVVDSFPRTIKVQPMASNLAMQTREGA